MQHTCSIRTPIGEMLAQVEQDHLCGLRFVDQKHLPGKTGESLEAPDHPLFMALRRQLDAWFSGALTTFDLPIALRGTPFQIPVWELLRTIPYGITTTYGALAGELARQREGKTPAPRAVGGAVGRNPISIIIPCHRVVGADGSLTGYAGGLERKVALLSLERRNAGGAA